MLDIDPNDEVILSAADYAQMLDEIKSLRNSLAESIRVREEMQLGGNRLAESLRFSKCRVEELEADIDDLHKENDRLTALLGKPKVLEAHEVTEPGWYWHKWPLQKEWQIVKVHHPEQAAGQFVGPLLAPEV